MVIEIELITDLDAWVEQALTANERVPDFWDDVCTSERIAAFLVSKGWTKP